MRWLCALVFLAATTVFATPTTVTLVGDLQTNFGCTSGQLPCAATELTYDASDEVWQATLLVPAGTWTWRAAIDTGSTTFGPRTLTLANAAAVKFYYRDADGWLTTKYDGPIIVAPGNFQSELGCAGDWQPDCLRSWLVDADGDGVATFTTTGLPAGSYDTKIAHDESWNENYGENGQPNGAMLPFTVPTDFERVTFSYVIATHVLTIVVGTPDAGVMDAGVDAGEVDAGDLDAGDLDAGDLDAGDLDAGDLDGGDVDAGGVDAGHVDAGAADAGAPDAGVMASDAGAATDAGVMPGTGDEASGCGCATVDPASLVGVLALMFALRRRAPAE
jgi:hypothetical protein